MKILFFINTLCGGGAEKVLVDLLRLLDKQKYQISLLTVEGGVHAERLPDNITYKSIIKTKSVFLKKLLQKIIYHLPPKIISALFIRGKYDIEIAYLEGFPTQVIAARKSRAKKIAFVHCDVSTTSVLRAFYKTKEKSVKEYKKYDKVCFVSRMAKSGFEQTEGILDNACVLHNVLDVENIIKKSQETNEIPFDAETFNIIAVGRLTEEKRYDRLIRAAAQLQDKYKFNVYILGDGEKRSELQTMINEQQVKNVELLGFKKNPYSYIKNANLFVCSSIFEGYSTVVKECLLLGVPVLTTDCAGMDELLENGKYGIIVPNNDNALIEQLECILKNPEIISELRQKIKAQNTCEQTKELAEYEKLFSEVYSNRSVANV